MDTVNSDRNASAPASPTVGGRVGLQPPTGGRLDWRIEDGAKANYDRLGRRLAHCEDLYRDGTDGHGLIQVLSGGKSRRITKASELAPILADRISMIVTKNGKVTGELPPAAHLNAMLRSEVFLTKFRPVDELAGTPYYLDDFRLARPGYHDGGPGKRVLYVGPEPRIGEGLETVHAFLDVMEFSTAADRTNAVAAALTVMLRHHFPGEKPLVLITATKSHAGKGTITEFVRGMASKADLLYESIDWPMQSQFQRQLGLDPDLGVVVIDNVRLDSAGGRGGFIRSAFIESFVTNAEVMLASPGAGAAVVRANKFVVVLNTNDGSLSQDLLNRSLPIHLSPRGSIQDRRSPIGNPKLEFLPSNRHRIEAELRGLIERWRSAGCPMDDSARHSMTPWAKAIGGILRLGGFTDFLGNQQARRVADDPLRRAVGLLGAARPGKALRPREWARITVQQGLAKTLIPANERDTEKGRERAIGVVLKPLIGETFQVETETKRLRLRLEGGLRRWVPGKNPHVRYRFEIIEEEALEADAH